MPDNEVGQGAPKNTKITSLEELTLTNNIAALLDKNELDEIASMVIDHIELDKNSMQDWNDDVEASLKLIELKAETKNTPWPDASNVRYPMIASAVIQFAARVGPEIVRGNKVVEIAVRGFDGDGFKADRAKRLSKFMSDQLLISDDTWEESNDKLLHSVAVTGTSIKKSWFDPVQGKIKSVFIKHDQVVINKDVPSLQEARRVTHLIDQHSNDLIQMERGGLYLKVNHLSEDEEKSQTVSDIHSIAEYHGYLDLDGDGYEEPYIITVHLGSKKTLRIVARYHADNIQLTDEDKVRYIEPNNFFTDYHFIPNPNGSFWSLGFGFLLLHLNESTNSVINQLMDSGTLANTQGGFLGRGFRHKSGTVEIGMGKWNRMDFGSGQDLAKNIVPLTYKEPSLVLFQMLGLMIETGKELSNVTDVLSGQQSAQNVPATTVLALVEQGLKVFSAIQKRLHRGYKREFLKIFDLNRVHLDIKEYQRVVDRPMEEIENDWDSSDLDVKPVSDPNMSSDATRIAQGQALLQVIDHPTTNARKIMENHFDNLNVKNPETFLSEEKPPPTPEQVKQEMEMIQAQHDSALADQEYQIQLEELKLKTLKTRAEVIKLEAEAVRNIAEAEAAEVGLQIDQYKIEAGVITEARKIEASQDEQRRANEVEKPPRN